MCIRDRTKIEEIRALFAIERVAEEFHRKYGRTPDENDVRECYKRFQDVLFATLEGYSNPIPVSYTHLFPI